MAKIRLLEIKNKRVSTKVFDFCTSVRNFNTRTVESCGVKVYTRKHQVERMSLYVEFELANYKFESIV